MAGPTITLTFQGDEADLVKAADHVGDAMEEMTDSIGKSARDIRSHSKAFDSMAEGTDRAEKKFTGFHDVVDGTTAGLAAWNDSSLSTTDKMIALGQSAADLSGGLTDFLIPAMSSVTTFMRGGLASAMSFIAAHPLMIALIALAAIFVLLWTRSQTFRDIVIGVFNAVAGFIKSVFGGAIDGIVTAWNAVISFFSSIPDRIGRALGSLGEIFKNVFKGAVNIGIDAINWFIDRANDLIYVINLINPFDDIPPIPKLQRMHTGGIVPGLPGTEVPIMALAGESVGDTVDTNRGSRGGNYALIASPGADQATGNFINQLIRRKFVQIVRVP